MIPKMNMRILLLVSVGIGALLGSGCSWYYPDGTGRYYHTHGHFHQGVDGEHHHGTESRYSHPGGEYHVH